MYICEPMTLQASPWPPVAAAAGQTVHPKRSRHLGNLGWGPIIVSVLLLLTLHDVKMNAGWALGLLVWGVCNGLGTGVSGSTAGRGSGRSEGGQTAGRGPTQSEGGPTAGSGGPTAGKGSARSLCVEACVGQLLLEALLLGARREAMGQLLLWEAEVGQLLVEAQ